MKELTYDDMVVGHQFPSVQYQVTKDQVMNYVEAVGDFNPLYVDEEYAKGSKYGGLIAPPSMAGLVTTLRVALGDVRIAAGTIHAEQYFKFIKPIRPGDRLVVDIKLADKFVKREKKFVVIESRVRNERGEVVVLARTTGMWPK